MHVQMDRFSYGILIRKFAFRVCLKCMSKITKLFFFFCGVNSKSPCRFIKKRRVQEISDFILGISNCCSTFSAIVRSRTFYSLSVSGCVNSECSYQNSFLYKFLFKIKFSGPKFHIFQRDSSISFYIKILKCNWIESWCSKNKWKAVLTSKDDFLEQK